jgi:hypothetical protein
MSEPLAQLGSMLRTAAGRARGRNRHQRAPTCLASFKGASIPLLRAPLAVAACSGPRWWSAEAANPGQVNWGVQVPERQADKFLQLTADMGISVGRHDRRPWRRVPGLGNHPISGDYPDSDEVHAGRTNQRCWPPSVSGWRGNQTHTDSRWPCLSTDRGWGRESPRTGGGSVGVAEEWGQDAQMRCSSKSR